MRERLSGSSASAAEQMASSGGPANTGSLNGQQTQQETEKVQPPYTMHGVLHFIQHEWSRYEMERSKWEMDRAELQARISFLVGERKGQENLKADLVRRIKMLEYCLKQERAKIYRLTHNGEEPPAFEDADNENVPDPNAPLDVDAYPLEGANSLGWKQGRQLLKQYLEEIGYSETILDVRSFRMKNLLGLIPPGQWPSNGTRDGKDAAEMLLYPPQKTAPNGSDSSSEHSNDAVKDEEYVEGQFQFLLQDEKKEEGKIDEWSHMNRTSLEQLKKKYKSEKQRKGPPSGSSSSYDNYTEEEGQRSLSGMESADDGVSVGGEAGLHHPQTRTSTTNIQRGPYMDINHALGLPPDEAAVDIKDVAGEQEEESESAQWNARATLRSHLDMIRCMQFHPVDPLLFTAGEDGTTKLWNLEAKPMNAKEGEKAKVGGSPSDLEPIYTFRGHAGPVLCMDISPTGDKLFTGGFDGVIACWDVPPANCDPYDPYERKVLAERLLGHTDAVWAVSFHSSDNRLLSASADGNIGMWEPGNFGEPLLRFFPPPVPEAMPTSIDFSCTDPQHLLAAYTNQTQAHILDMETGKTVLSFEFPPEEGQASNDSRITRILSHPTMPITVMADGRVVRYFDNNTGKQLHSHVAHVEGISSLAIDSNGLYLLSGSHDGSMRMWNIEKKSCLKELPAHRKKWDNAVTCVAIHPSRPFIASAGADSLAKVFTTDSRYWSSGQY